jgi:hypothetical protein
VEGAIVVDNRPGGTGILPVFASNGAGPRTVRLGGTGAAASDDASVESPLYCRPQDSSWLRRGWRGKIARRNASTRCITSAQVSDCDKAIATSKRIAKHKTIKQDHEPLKWHEPNWIASPRLAPYPRRRAPESRKGLWLEPEWKINPASSLAGCQCHRAYQHWQDARATRPVAHKAAYTHAIVNHY